MNPRLRTLNRKVHIYLGLALLAFTVLFSGTGLLLNHHWRFAEFWPNRQVIRYERPVAPLAGADDVARARDLMRQLDLRGEIGAVEQSPDGGVRVQAARPGESLKIAAGVRGGTAAVERTRVNGWGVMRSLHTFVGVSLDDPERARDWWLTRLWSLAIDLAAVGLILLTAGGLYEAWVANPRRAPGAAVLAAALAACAVFVMGLFP